MLEKRLIFILFKNKNLHFSKRLFSSDSLDIWNEELNDTLKHRIEKYWTEKLPHNSFQSEDLKQKYYVLSMFPYPSGNLHLGHVRVYTISDTIARFYKLNGKNVLHPMGWDAFGLPAENAAIERSIPAKEWTFNNIKTMKNQLNELACDFDWGREITTCDPEYYKFTQEIFLRMYDEGLVYRKEALVNWDPIDETVLADEQVDEKGCSWRSGAKVEKKILKQWFIRTTKFAKALYNGLDDPNLKDWRDIVNLQKHWIGECDGASFEFQLKGENFGETFLNIWTSKPEHIINAKFVTVTSGSVLDKRCIGEGPRKLNVTIINPLNGQLLPVFVTDNIDYELGRDCHLGIPNLYKSDKEFADKFNIPYDNEELDDNLNQRLLVIEKLNGIESSSKIRDWLISRQRYWGTPIPIVHCKTCGIQPVPYDKLPVMLSSKNITSENDVNQEEKNSFLSKMWW
uniref:leucine--tRNA ligase n=1 Tax=Clastoptera arizonana TaxID=38151 RepID=A0A1B6E5K5_9HEMI